MAYQPKSYRKFLAGAVTTALVATAVAPVAGAEAASVKFTDDDQLGSAKDAIYQAVELGLIKGYADGSYKPLNEINRGQVVKILARHVGDVDTTGVENFKDVVNHPDAELVEAALKVKAAGVFDGTKDGNLLPSNKISRQQMAKVLVNAFGLEKKEGQGTNVADLDKAFADFKEYIEIVAQNEVTVVENFNPLGNVSRAQFASFVVRAVEATTPVEVAPEVVSVSAINAKQVVVNFSSAMDADSLIDSSDDRLKNITFSATTSGSDAVVAGNATGKLSADGKELTITLGTGETFEGTYAITVNSDAKTKSGENLKDYAGTFSIKDEVAPQIVKVSATTNTNVATSAKVNFSEPVSAAVVKINGTVYATSGMGTTELTITGLALEAGKNHTVEVLNATDAKNNINPLQSTTFQVNKDTVAPTVSYKAEGDHQILLTFNKDMDVASITPSSVKVVEEDLTSLASPADYTVTQVGTSKKEFTITVNKALYGSKSARTLTVQVNDNAKDSLGNKAVVTTQNVNLTKDTVAPTVANVSVVNDKQGNAEKLRVTFSEKLNGAPADLSAITAKNATEGTDAVVTDLLDVATINLLDDDKTIEVNVKTAALGKKFNLAFSKGFVKDTAQTPNDSVAFSRTVEFKSAASAFKLVQGDLTITTANTIVIDFGQKVVGDFGANAANNPANYTVAGQTLPADTNITIDSTREKATIVLPAEFVAKTDTNAVFTVNNVKSTEGATVTPFVGFVNVKDNITPKLEKAEWNKNGSFTLTFSEAITAATSEGTEDGVEIKLNDDMYTLADTDYTFAAGTGADAGKIVVTFVVANDATHGDYIDINGDSSYTAGTDILIANIENVSVKILANSGIQDAAGNDAKADLKVKASK